ncbi:MAG: hypothetical protein ABI399_08495 [Bauldia sp.]
MGRVVNFVLLALMLVGAAVTYSLKYKAEVAANHVARLQSNIAREKAQLQILKAEWSMLIQPARLQAVVDVHNNHFLLLPFTPAQLVSVGEIPLKPPAADPIAAIAAAATAEKPIALQ